MTLATDDRTVSPDIFYILVNLIWCAITLQVFLICHILSFTNEQQPTMQSSSSNYVHRECMFIFVDKYVGSMQQSFMQHPPPQFVARLFVSPAAYLFLSVLVP